MGDRIVTVLRRGLFQALRTGDLEEAAALLERLKHEDPLALETRGMELEYLLRGARLAEAEALSEQLLRDHPDSARIAFLAGRVAYQMRSYPRARELFAEAHRLAPHWRSRLWLGKTLTQLGALAEAEPILIELAAERPACLRDLAWLYERMGDEERALAQLDAYRQSYPDDAFARAQAQRLRARLAGPERLAREVVGLRELGEEVPGEILVEYVESLLAGGEETKARELVQESAARLDDGATTRLAWVCHRAKLPDLAYSLFVVVLPAGCRNIKFLNALENDAGRCGRLEELAALYRAHASREPRLHGRARTLMRRAAGGQGRDG